MSYKLISVLKAADDGCFDIFAAKIEAAVDKSPSKAKSSDEKIEDGVEEVGENQRSLKMAQHKQWLESVKQLFKTMAGLEKTMNS